MTTKAKEKKATAANAKTEARKAELNFQRIAQDKTLPSFGNFFIECLVRGTAEKVNLKAMYPDVYKKCSAWVKEHKEEILAMRE